MKPSVVIHTNDKQMLGALVSAHSYRRNSRDAGCVRRAHRPRRTSSRSFGAQGNSLHPRRTCSRLGSRRPPVVYAAALRRSRRGRTPGAGASHRSRRVRGRRCRRALRPRPSGQGDLVPSAAGLRQDHRSARDLGHAARLREAAALALRRGSARRCGTTASTISTG